MTLISYKIKNSEDKLHEFPKQYVTGYLVFKEQEVVV